MGKGQLRDDGHDGEKIVRDFLKALEKRDLKGASALLAEGAQLSYPGGKRFSGLEPMFANAKERYQWVKKRIDATEVLPGDIQTSIVYVRGTLYGINLAEVSFEGVRFIDRFEIKGGKIVRQDVWNDLAESGALT